MIKLTEKIDLTNFTFMVPAVGVGNVAQLAVDLLIFNGNMTRIGQAVCPNFIPFVGTNPYDENSTEFCTTADLYYSEEKKNRRSANSIATGDETNPFFRGIAGIRDRAENIEGDNIDEQMAIRQSRQRASRCCFSLRCFADYGS